MTGPLFMPDSTSAPNIWRAVSSRSISVVRLSANSARVADTTSGNSVYRGDMIMFSVEAMFDSSVSATNDTRHTLAISISSQRQRSAGRRSRSMIFAYRRLVKRTVLTTSQWQVSWISPLGAVDMFPITSSNQWNYEKFSVDCIQVYETMRSDIILS